MYLHYSNMVCRFVQKFVKSPELAEDLAQEVFAKIWDSHANVSPEHSFAAYLFTLTRNHTIDFIRKAVGIKEALAEMYRYTPITVQDAAAPLELQQYLDQIKVIYESLPQQTQQVFKMVRSEDKSYDEVAALLGITRNAVKKHMVRANKAFKQSIENDLGISLSALLAIFFQS